MTSPDQTNGSIPDVYSVVTTGKHKGKRFIDVPVDYAIHMSKIGPSEDRPIYAKVIEAKQIIPEDPDLSIPDEQQIDKLPPTDFSAITLLAKAIVEELQKANNTTYQVIEPIHIHGSTRQSEYDKADYLDVPKVFFSFTIGFAILDDAVDGRVRPHPLRRAIQFKHAQSFKQVTGSGERDFRIVHVCYYECRSKKEYEWLKGTQAFLTGKISEKVDDLKSVDMRRYECEIEAGETLGRMEPAEVMRMAQMLRQVGNAIPISENLNQMRLALRPHLAKQIMEERQRQTEIILNSTESGMGLATKFRESVQQGNAEFVRSSLFT